MLKARISFLKAVRESIMPKGISEKSKQLRRHLLSHNGPDVAKSMAVSIPARK